MNTLQQQSELKKWWESFEPIEFAPSDELEAMSLREVRAYLAELNSDKSVMVQNLGLAKDENNGYSSLDFNLSKQIRKTISAFDSEIGKVTARMHLLFDGLHSQQREEKQSALELEKVKLERDRIRIDAEIKKEEIKAQYLLEKEKVALERDRMKAEVVRIQTERDVQNDQLFHTIAKEVLPRDVYLQIWMKANRANRIDKSA